MSEKLSLNTTKPFLKWAGGKFRVLETLKQKFPHNRKRYIEPFLGAGSVALNVNYPVYIVNDINHDLFCVWKNLQVMQREFIFLAKELFIEENNKREIYDQFKSEFNETNDKLRKSLLFIYLNRHCFNGLCRYNSKGKFNTPFGKYNKPYFPEEEMISCINKASQFQIYNTDFRDIFNLAEEGDLIYCDPPYVPMSESASFSNYSTDGFKLKDHIQLAECASKAAEKGCTVVVSNHGNWYTKQLYADMFGAKVSFIDVSRVISSKGSRRNAVKEVIAVFG